MHRITKQDFAIAVANAINSINRIKDLTADFTKADFGFVDQFKEASSISLMEASEMLKTAGAQASVELRTLAEILYVREAESTREVGDWRSIAKTNKLVDAIRVLREGTGIDVIGARLVVEAYRKSEF